MTATTPGREFNDVGANQALLPGNGIGRFDAISPGDIPRRRSAQVSRKRTGLHGLFTPDHVNGIEAPGTSGRAIFIHQRGTMR